MKKILCMILAWILCLSMAACGGCEHEWKEADCEHPKTCTLCGETEGKPLDHSWQEADCTHPKTCSRCGAAEGEALGHQPGDWKRTDIDIMNAEAAYEKKCSRCGAVVDTRKEEMDCLFENKTFLMTPDEFAERLNKTARETEGPDFEITNEPGADGLTCWVRCGGVNVAYVVYMEKSGYIPNGEGNSDRFAGAMGLVYPTDYAGKFLVSYLRAVDPSLTDAEIEVLGPQIIQCDMNTHETVTKNGIMYLGYMSSGGMAFAGMIPQK